MIRLWELNLGLHGGHGYRLLERSVEGMSRLRLWWGGCMGRL